MLGRLDVAGVNDERRDQIETETLRPFRRDRRDRLRALEFRRPRPAGACPASRKSSRQCRPTSTTGRSDRRRTSSAVLPTIDQRSPPRPWLVMQTVRSSDCLDDRQERIRREVNVARDRLDGNARAPFGDLGEIRPRFERPVIRRRHKEHSPVHALGERARDRARPARRTVTRRAARPASWETSENLLHPVSPARRGS